MANIKEAFSATATSTAITVTLTSLANLASRECTAIDNSSNLYVDILLRVKTNSIAAGTGTLDVYAVGALETTSSIYTDNATGSDAAFTTANIKNARYIGSVQLNAATIVVAGPWSLARAFDGNLPVKIGLIFNNNAGQILSATAGDHAIAYQGVYATAI